MVYSFGIVVLFDTSTLIYVVKLNSVIWHVWMVRLASMRARCMRVNCMCVASENTTQVHCFTRETRVALKRLFLVGGTVVGYIY